MSSFVVGTLTRELIDGSIAADLIGSVVPDADERSWVVRVDDGASWSDGSPVTIDEAVSGIRAVARHPAHRLAAHLDSERPVEVVDSSRAVVHLRRPSPYFPALLTQPQFAPRPGKGNRRTLAEYVVERSDGSSLQLTPSGIAESRKPDNVTLRVVPRGGSVAALAAGDVDITTTTGLTAMEVEHFARRGTLHSGMSNLSGDLHVGPRLLKSGAGLDLARHLRAVTDTHAVVRGIEPLVRAAPDPAPSPPARDVRPMQQSGIGQLSLIVPAYSPNLDVVRSAVAQWDLRGWTVVIRELAMRAYIEKLSAGDYDLAYVISPLEFPHPLARFTPWMRGGGLARWTGTSNPVLDRCVEECLERGLTPEAEAELYVVWLDSAPVIPLVQTRFNYALSREGVDIDLTPSGLARISAAA